MSPRLQALVIGNGAYQTTSKLLNPVNDAEDIGHLLETCGFTVLKSTDSTHHEMDQALDEFQVALETSDVGLFFFAGHGVQIKGENYLAGVDVKVKDEISAKHSSLALNRVIEVMDNSACATSIVILDACRNNPFTRAWSRSMEDRGLAPVYAPRGTLIAYATSPGQTASDGKGRNGDYTAALLQHLTTPDCSIETMFKRVRNTLGAATEQQQISWEHTSLAGEFFFNLSLSVRIDIYDKTALSDKLFVLDDAKTSHKVVQELKSSNWYAQNAAIDSFTVDVANQTSIDTLFVIGRNLYQAACGNANNAISYIERFASRTTGIETTKRKAILDGMLFEAFYDPDAKLRDSFKLRQFGSLFALQLHDELMSSFDFIAECLLLDIGRFHAIPGKRHEVAVDVKFKALDDGDDRRIVEAVIFGGKNILWLEDDDYLPDPSKDPRYSKLNRETLEARLSEQMIVPAHLLKITYPTPGLLDSNSIHFPLGWTTRKRPGPSASTPTLDSALP
ncbi:caspase family protein [Comamonas odontotermitis]|uniref:caspase family protein n=1 Tax=Comamonas odontotermitis TaxID=379895 RepID=UPI001CC62A19|nr:caspase family protein [Comamonas odontotermitis]UBB15386.1 caspase family protein [Comamonas odontotermitis]